MHLAALGNLMAQIVPIFPEIKAPPVKAEPMKCGLYAIFSPAG